MRSAIMLFIFSCVAAIAKAQTTNSHFISIDHVPVAVKNLTAVKKLLTALHFTIKEGKEHEGIKNCFIKFPDGTYLEFTSPVDSVQPTSRYYTEFLKNRQGGTSLAISTDNADSLENFLTASAVPYTTDSNRIWKTVEPKGLDLFFIAYVDKQWKDSKTNTTHGNTARSLASVYMLSPNVDADVKKYTGMGFKELKNTQFLQVPHKHLQIGRSNLYLLESAASKKITQSFSTPATTGICGFEIKTRSLKTFNKLLANYEKRETGKHHTIIYLNDINLFFIFTE